ncbi:MAG: glycosyltransferase [Anaerolineae bacterium]
MPIIEAIYAVSVLLLAIYGLNSLFLTLLFWLWRRRKESNPPPLMADGHWPTVTVQLPIFNELHVVERLIAAVAEMDYPRDKLQIQVLDDSTDRTQVIVREAVERYRRRGLDIEYCHRTNRRGFKAGALAAGLTEARGEILALFDADFLPRPDFLLRTIPYFADPRIGCIQTRWDHLNADYSFLTRAQAIGIDGHFIVEQTARNRHGFFINFNGTAGLWRRSCIEEAGGWCSDTLTEDLDLSYRAQLAGWRFLYLPHVTVPGELPAQIDALKRQQFRWAKGSIQTAAKLLLPLWRSRFPLWIKVEGTIHLTNYLAHPIMVVLLLLALPIGFSRSPLLAFIPYLLISAIGPPLLYYCAQANQEQPWWRRLLFLLILILLGTGLSWSNSMAIFQAVIGTQSDFRRTPKFGIQGRGERWQDSLYSLPRDASTWGELLLGVYAASLFLYTAFVSHMSPPPWLIIYALGYAYVSGLSLWQSLGYRRRIRTALARSSISLPAVLPASGGRNRLPPLRQ